MRRLVFGIDTRQTTFAVRGFDTAPGHVRRHLEGHALTFVEGYHLALEHDDVDALAQRLAARVPPARLGFAYEGASMAHALLDLLPLPGRGRLSRLLAGPGAPYRFLVHVGPGWAFARLRRRPWGRLVLDPVLRWLVFDGYGFHQAFFAPPTAAALPVPPRGVPAYGARSFDQGVGRALWFVRGGDPDRITGTVGAVAPGRHADIWSGVGLAACYAGGVDRGVLERLVDRAGPFLPELAQGAAAAAAARVRAGNVLDETELACAVICGLTPVEAAALVEAALEDVRGLGDGAYEQARRQVQARWRTAQARAERPDRHALSRGSGGTQRIRTEPGATGVRRG